MCSYILTGCDFIQVCSWGAVWELGWCYGEGDELGVCTHCVPVPPPEGFCSSPMMSPCSLHTLPSVCELRCLMAVACRVSGLCTELWGITPPFSALQHCEQLPQPWHCGAGGDHTDRTALGKGRTCGPASAVGPQESQSQLLKTCSMASPSSQQAGRAHQHSGPVTPLGPRAQTRLRVPMSSTPGPASSCPDWQGQPWTQHQPGGRSWYPPPQN